MANIENYWYAYNGHTLLENKISVYWFYCYVLTLAWPCLFLFLNKNGKVHCNLIQMFFQMNVLLLLYFVRLAIDLLQVEVCCRKKTPQILQCLGVRNYF